MRDGNKFVAHFFVCIAFSVLWCGQFKDVDNLFLADSFKERDDCRGNFFADIPFDPLSTIFYGELWQKGKVDP